MGGTPLFCTQKLIGIVTEKADAYLYAKSIKPIAEKLRLMFVPEEKVKAEWTDGFEYNAVVKCKVDDKKYEIHYYEFGEETLEQDCSTLKKLAEYDEIPKIEGKVAPTKDDSEWNEVVEWLNTMKCEKYIDEFKEKGYDSMEKIKSSRGKEMTENLELVGMKAGSIARLTNNLTTTKSYLMTDEIKNLPQTYNNFIPLIKNDPMPENWKPTTTDRDLTEELSIAGNCSVGSNCTKIKQGEFPKECIPGEKFKFYLLSSRHQRYFVITITW